MENPKKKKRKRANMLHFAVFPFPDQSSYDMIPSQLRYHKQALRRYAHVQPHCCLLRRRSE